MRIFNQLRRKLLKEGKLEQYLKYAFGEIVLVVIGILIALGINNKRDESKSNAEKQVTIEILLQSFEKNKAEILRTREKLIKTLHINNLRIENTGPKIDNIRQSIIDSMRIINIVRLDLANNLSSQIFVDKQNSAKLSGETRNLLLEYTSTYSEYKHTEENVKIILLKLREIHQKHISLITELASNSDLELNPDHYFESDYIAWLRDRDNQNLSVEAKWKIEISLELLKNLSDVNDLVIEKLKNEIQND